MLLYCTRPTNRRERAQPLADRLPCAEQMGARAYKHAQHIYVHAHMRSIYNTRTCVCLYTYTLPYILTLTCNRLARRRGIAFRSLQANSRRRGSRLGARAMLAKVHTKPGAHIEILITWSDAVALRCCRRRCCHCRSAIETLKLVLINVLT